MKGAKKYLLSTRPLPKAIAEEAARKNVVLEELSFISTEPVTDEVLFQKIKELAAEPQAVVFTSMNAVEVVAALVPSTPLWKVYSIGNTTRQLIEENWGRECIAATAENAQRLGERLVDDGIKEVVFFCGNRRRDELPNKLRSEGGKVKELVVYKTEETPVALAKAYDGILFFSPSAAAAFYQQNKPGKTTVFFAIGQTTEEALRKYGAKKIVVAGAADKIELARQAVAYLANDADRQ